MIPAGAAGLTSTSGGLTTSISVRTTLVLAQGASAGTWPLGTGLGTIGVGCGVTGAGGGSGVVNHGAGADTLAVVGTWTVGGASGGRVGVGSGGRVGVGSGGRAGGGAGCASGALTIG
jgi:hypothetical protein